MFISTEHHLVSVLLCLMLDKHLQNTHGWKLTLSRKVKQFKRKINGIKSFQMIWVLITQMTVLSLRIIGRWIDNILIFIVD